MQKKRIAIFILCSFLLNTIYAGNYLAPPGVSISHPIIFRESTQNIELTPVLYAAVKNNFISVEIIAWISKKYPELEGLLTQIRRDDYLEWQRIYGSNTFDVFCKKLFDFAFKGGYEFISGCSFESFEEIINYNSSSPFREEELDFEGIKGILEIDNKTNRFVLKKLHRKKRKEHITENMFMRSVFNKILTVPLFFTHVDADPLTLPPEINQLLQKAEKMNSDSGILDEYELLILNKGLLQAVYPCRMEKNKFDNDFQKLTGYLRNAYAITNQEFSSQNDMRLIFEHAIAVAQLCRIIGEKLGLEHNDIKKLITTALFHEAGKRTTMSIAGLHARLQSDPSAVEKKYAVFSALIFEKNCLPDNQNNDLNKDNADIGNIIRAQHDISKIPEKRKDLQVLCEILIVADMLDDIFDATQKDNLVSGERKTFEYAREKIVSKLSEHEINGSARQDIVDIITELHESSEDQRFNDVIHRTDSLLVLNNTIQIALMTEKGVFPYDRGIELDVVSENILSSGLPLRDKLSQFQQLFLQNETDSSMNIEIPEAKPVNEAEVENDTCLAVSL